MVAGAFVGLFLTARAALARVRELERLLSIATMPARQPNPAAKPAKTPSAPPVEPRPEPPQTPPVEAPPAAEPAAPPPPTQDLPPKLEPMLPSGPPRDKEALILEHHSNWQKLLRPLLYENFVLFLGAFLILAGSLFGLSDAWHRSTEWRPLLVVGILALYTHLFLGVGYWLTRKPGLHSLGLTLLSIPVLLLPFQFLGISVLRDGFPILALAAAAGLGTLDAACLLVVGGLHHPASRKRFAFSLLSLCLAHGLVFSWIPTGPAAGLVFLALYVATLRPFVHKDLPALYVDSSKTSLFWLGTQLFAFWTLVAHLHFAHASPPTASVYCALLGLHAWLALDVYLVFAEHPRPPKNLKFWWGLSLGLSTWSVAQAATSSFGELAMAALLATLLFCRAQLRLPNPLHLWGALALSLLSYGSALLAFLPFQNPSLILALLVPYVAGLFWLELLRSRRGRSPGTILAWATLVGMGAWAACLTDSLLLPWPLAATLAYGVLALGCYLEWKRAPYLIASLLALPIALELVLEWMRWPGALEVLAGAALAYSAAGTRWRATAEGRTALGLGILGAGLAGGLGLAIEELRAWPGRGNFLGAGLAFGACLAALPALGETASFGRRVYSLCACLAFGFLICLAAPLCTPRFLWQIGLMGAAYCGLGFFLGSWKVDRLAFELATALAILAATLNLPYNQRAWDAPAFSTLILLLIPLRRPNRLRALLGWCMLLLTLGLAMKAQSWNAPNFCLGMSGACAGLLLLSMLPEPYGAAARWAAFLAVYVAFAGLLDGMKVIEDYVVWFGDWHTAHVLSALLVAGSMSASAARWRGASLDSLLAGLALVLGVGQALILLAWHGETNLLSESVGAAAGFHALLWTWRRNDWAWLALLGSLAVTALGAPLILGGYFREPALAWSWASTMLLLLIAFGCAGQRLANRLAIPGLAASGALAVLAGAAALGWPQAWAGVAVVGAMALAANLPWAEWLAPSPPRTPLRSDALAELCCLGAAGLGIALSQLNPWTLAPASGCLLLSLGLLAAARRHGWPRLLYPVAAGLWLAGAFAMAWKGLNYPSGHPPQAILPMLGLLALALGEGLPALFRRVLPDSDAAGSGIARSSQALAFSLGALLALTLSHAGRFEATAQLALAAALLGAWARRGEYQAAFLSLFLGLLYLRWLSPWSGLLSLQGDVGLWLGLGFALLALAKIGPDRLRPAAWTWCLLAPLGLAPWLDGADATRIGGLLLASSVLYLAAAMETAKRRPLAYLAALTFDGGLLLVFSGQGLQNSTLYTAPLGITLLLLTQMEHARLDRRTRFQLQNLGVALCCGSAAYENLIGGGLQSFLVLLGLCLGGAFAGLMLRIRAFVFVSTGVLIATILGQLLRHSLELALPMWALLTTLGTLITGLTIFVSWKRQQILAWYRLVVEDFEQWD